MHVILTHEQADFDAMAALLGARLLDEDALAVLPRRLNRNTRAYLALYSAELPFIDPRDLPQEVIDSVTLVDTQSLITLKGLSNATRVVVLDHHARRADFPEDWKSTIDLTGAVTTLLVEMLAQKNQGVLASAEATLLLLGIYEDTGSLTYAGTTPRDVKAAAYLIEHGASLKILSQFLNPPLSAEQRNVYQLLMESCQTRIIQGQRVILAQVNAESLTDEISSIAHKMREVLDPDGLFILVSTGEGIRIVARSVSDKVNVAHILARFGGGGHDRAASCLIQLKDIPKVGKAAPLRYLTGELIQTIEKEIPRVVTVGQIMSKKPRLIDPQTPVDQALTLMQRYGYEGFPVAEKGLVIGLLTRRAVDRAISHKLNLPAVSLMDAGQITVHPDDPIDHLREVIVSSGWGQIPVIDPDSGKVVGIATRTDLIKIMTPTQTTQNNPNLADKLEAALPPVRLALLKAVVGMAVEKHMAVYIVGGYVRDLLLERPGIDFDLVVEGDALQLGRSLAKKYGGRIITHARFNTAKWFIHKTKDTLAGVLGKSNNDFATELPQNLDLISARMEFYDYPTALPTVESSGIKLDLHRRDFTINTLALRLDGHHYGELHDYWGGLKDLRKGVIRVLHSLSFIDDPTRLLRAARFEQRFGFRIEKRTLELMSNALDVIRQVSGDRLRHEFNLILLEPKAGAILLRLQQLGVLTAIHPAIGALVSDQAELPVFLEPGMLEEWKLPAEIAGMEIQLAVNWLVWLGRLPSGSVEIVSSRLRLPTILNKALAATTDLLAKRERINQQSTSQLVSTLERYPLLAIKAACLISGDIAFVERSENFVYQLRYIHPSLDGEDLMRMGLKPSPRYKKILSVLRSAWLDGRINNSSEEKKLLDELIVEFNDNDEYVSHSRK